MRSFGEYVDGKTIAVVGPAPAPYDQTDEVNAHDIVYRTVFGARPEQCDHPEYPANVLPAGYGARADIMYLNGQTTDMAADGQFDHQLPYLDWVVCKLGTFATSGLVNVRTANWPPMRSPGTHNQITGMLWDLTHYSPAKVTVFGANFYTSLIEDWYAPEYIPQEYALDRSHWHSDVSAIQWHDQQDNKRIVRMIKEVGWLAGDARYLAALDMPADEHEALLEAQIHRAYAEETAA
jgi:hypothetical protein